MNLNSQAWMIILLCAAFPSLAADEAAELTGSQPVIAPPAVVHANSTNARLVEPVPPIYPESERRAGREGWVVLSMVIRPDGTVADPVVQDSSGVRQFERAALIAAAKQRFTPATVDGKPVEQCAQNVAYSFSLRGGPRGVRRRFRREIRAIEARLSAGELAGAAAAIDALEAKSTHTLYEAGALHLLHYELCRLQEDIACQLRHLRQATAGGMYLSMNLYRHALVAKGILEIEERRYGDALATIDRLTAIDPPLESDHPLQQAGRELDALIEGPANLRLPGVITRRAASNDSAVWDHRLLRRHFTVENVAGRVSMVDIRCDWRRTVFDYSPENAWRVPESWGECHVLLSGEEGTTFDLVEYPLEDAVATVGSVP